MDSCRKIISDSKKAALNKMIDEGELSSTQMAIKLGLKPKTVANYKGRYLKAKKGSQVKKAISKKVQKIESQQEEKIDANIPVISEKKPIGRPKKVKVLLYLRKIVCTVDIYK